MSWSSTSTIGLVSPRLTKILTADPSTPTKQIRSNATDFRYSNAPSPHHSKPLLLNTFIRYKYGNTVHAPQAKQDRSQRPPYPLHSETIFTSFKPAPRISNRKNHAHTLCQTPRGVHAIPPQKNTAPNREERVADPYWASWRLVMETRNGGRSFSPGSCSKVWEVFDGS